jgi:DNA-binding MarR family transcriptional regulator
MKAKWAKGEFERFRETWSRQVLADKELDHRAARVASFLVWHLNRETRTCFPSLSTIAKGIRIDRADASKDIDELVARGHLKKREYPRGRKNEYLPVLWEALEKRQQGVGKSPTPVGESPTPVLESRESLSSNSKGLSGVTSDIEPLTEPLNLTSDIAHRGELATAPLTGALARPKSEERKKEESDEGKGEKEARQVKSVSSSNSSNAGSLPPHPRRSARPPSPPPPPLEESELGAALKRFDAAHLSRSNGGLTSGSSDVMRAQRWRQ